MKKKTDSINKKKWVITVSVVKDFRVRGARGQQSCAKAKNIIINIPRAPVVVVPVAHQAVVHPLHLPQVVHPALVVGQVARLKSSA